MAGGAAPHEINQGGNGAFQANAPSGFHQVFAANAAKFRIVPNQIRQLASLLNQIGSTQAGNARLESGYPEQFAQDQSGILEAQRLIEV